MKFYFFQKSKFDLDHNCEAVDVSHFKRIMHYLKFYLFMIQSSGAEEYTNCISAEE